MARIKQDEASAGRALSHREQSFVRLNGPGAGVVLRRVPERADLYGVQAAAGEVVRVVAGRRRREGSELLDI